jgi:hypothetical protein
MGTRFFLLRVVPAARSAATTRSGVNGISAKCTPKGDATRGTLLQFLILRQSIYPSIARASSIEIINVSGSTGEARKPCFS